MSNPLPGVNLTQSDVSSTATLADAEMFPVFVSPLYRVVTKKKVRSNLAFATGGVSELNKIALTYPVVDTGAVIDISSIILYMINGVAQIAHKDTGGTGFTAGNAVFTDSSTDFLALGIKAGDVVYPSTLDGLNGKYVVQSVAQHSLTFTYDIYKTISTDAGYYITRTIDSYTIDSVCYTANQSGISLTAAYYGSTGLIFLSGEIDISYRALRKDLTGLIKYESLSDVKNDMEIDNYALNKLGYTIAKGIIPANGDAHSFWVYILDENSDDAYLEALEDLAKEETAYILVPLTTSDTVNDAYAAHAVAMSAPAESMFRITILNTTLTTQTTLGSGSVTLS